MSEVVVDRQLLMDAFVKLTTVAEEAVGVTCMRGRQYDSCPRDGCEQYIRCNMVGLFCAMAEYKRWQRGIPPCGKST